MHPQEITTSLDAPHIAVVATVNWNATPHLTPNGYRYDGKVLTFITRTDRLKYGHLQWDPRISMCIDDPPVASNDVVISGRSICHDQDIWDEARRIIALQGAGGSGRLSGTLAIGAAGAHHGNPEVHLKAGDQETISGSDATATMS